MFFFMPNCQFIKIKGIELGCNLRESIRGVPKYIHIPLKSFELIDYMNRSRIV